MTMSLGRIFGLNEPNNWDADGDHVTISGSYLAASVLDGLSRRQQLLGLIDNPDEPVIPVVVDNEPRVTGFYRPVRVHVPTDDFTRLRGNLYDYQIELERVLGYADPLIESSLVGALMTNTSGVASGTAQPWHSIPDAALEYFYDTTQVEIDRAGEGVTLATFIVPNIYSAYPRFYLRPADYYDGAVRLEVGTFGGPYQVVTGRQVLPGNQSLWHLDNGLIRVFANQLGQLALYQWTGSVWSAVVTFLLTNSGSNGLSSNVLTVMRNSPEEVRVRIACGIGGGTFYAAGPVNLDITLRRGSYLARCRITSRIGSAWQITGAWPGAVAATALTGGLVRTTGAPRHIVASASAYTTNLATSFLAASASTTNFDFAVGMEPVGAAGNNLAQQLVYQYLAAQTETQRVVGR